MGGRADAVYCDLCGGPVNASDHRECVAARALEPPRYCPTCRRRMIVQVTPTGWQARCSRHGEHPSGNAPAGGG